MKKQLPNTKILLLKTKHQQNALLSYHTLNSEAEVTAGIKGTGSKPPKIQPGDVITYKTGVINPETGEEETKTVIWTGSDTGFI